MGERGCCLWARFEEGQQANERYDTCSRVHIVLSWKETLGFYLQYPQGLAMSGLGVPLCLGKACRWFLRDFGYKPEDEDDFVREDDVVASFLQCLLTPSTSFRVCRAVPA